MRVLAIDPGFERVGIAILEKNSGREVVLFSECFTTDRKEVFPKRLAAIGEHLREIIKKWKPEALSIEKLYLTQNQKTVMGVAEARGVMLYEAGRNNIPVYEYTPIQVKVAVVGYGRAPKNQMMKMVEKLVKIPQKISSDDEIDAIALGITFFAHFRG